MREIIEKYAANGELKNSFKEFYQEKKTAFGGLTPETFGKIYAFTKTLLYNITKSITAYYLFTGPIYDRLGAEKTVIFIMVLILVWRIRAQK